MSKRKSKTTKELIDTPPTPSTPPAKAEGPPCPKCGSEKGWTGPNYQRGRRVTVRVPWKPNSFRNENIDTVESLDYTCNQCGYTRHEPCKDTIEGV